MPFKENVQHMRSYLQLNANLKAGKFETIRMAQDSVQWQAL